VVDVRALRLIAPCVAVVVLAACGGPVSALRPPAPVTRQSPGQTPAKLGVVASPPDGYPVSPPQVGLLGVPVDLSLKTGSLSATAATVVTTIQIRLDAILPSAAPLTGCSQFTCGAPPPEKGVGKWSAFKFSVSNLSGEVLEEADGTSPGVEFYVDSNPEAQLTTYGFVGCPALGYHDLPPGSAVTGCVAIWVPAGRAAPKSAFVKLSVAGLDATDPSIRWQV